MTGLESNLVSFVENLASQMTYGAPANTQSSVVMFSYSSYVLSYPELGTTFQDVRTALQGYYPDGLTNIGMGLQEAKDIWDRAEAAGTYNGNQKVIVLISDGEQSPTYGGPASALQKAEEIKASGITIFAVGFGLVSSDTLRQIASSP